MRHRGMLKVIRGTRSGDRLCDTCRKAYLIRGPGESQEAIECSVLSRTPRWPVVECSMYDDKRMVSLREMRETAWVLTGEVKGKVGFLRSSEWVKKHQDEDIVPDSSY